jgi:agmatinase
MASRGVDPRFNVPGGFLALPEEHRTPTGAGVFVLPIPYEETVSYETGTREGPQAIITASQQVELWDPDFHGEPALSYGVHTLPALGPRFRSPEDMMERTSAAAEEAIRQGKLLLALGGEHSLTPALVKGVRRIIDEPLTVVQIDAHADLRDSYLGTRYSHACAMRRVLEENPGPALQIGIRSLCAEEARFIGENRRRLTVWTADLIEKEDPSVFLKQLSDGVKGRKVYLTIDVDGLDPAVIPATGTPEPGGLTWRQTLDIVKTVAVSATVVAVDCVELAPRPGLHMAEFAAAKLLYKTLSYIMSERKTESSMRLG